MPSEPQCLRLRVPTMPSSRSPFCGPGPAFQHQPEDSQTFVVEDPDAAFEWSTPEHSPRVWKPRDDVTCACPPTTSFGAPPAGSMQYSYTYYVTQLPVPLPVTTMMGLGYGCRAYDQTCGQGAAGMGFNSSSDARPVFVPNSADGNQVPSCAGDNSSQHDTASELNDVPEGHTTFVIRNIPARYTQEMLLQEFGSDPGLDMLFTPYSFKDKKTIGVAFVNFQSPALAEQFFQHWHRQTLRNHGKTKHLDIAAATVQGIAATMQQFNAKNVGRLRRMHMLPIFLDQAGQRLDPIAELKRYGVIGS
eukprot:gb/GFBE01011403.1/.p1 GENE.gb/GFBE01011403.1/~~gb/GFBE01011403.1/.p1  ORF type:complete len:304 (+),score=43.72 gb/GFBE01011403.1/:1-912(+)